jgi:hypothetical protein
MPSLSAWHAHGRPPRPAMPQLLSSSLADLDASCSAACFSLKAGLHSHPCAHWPGPHPQRGGDVRCRPATNPAAQQRGRRCSGPGHRHTHPAQGAALRWCCVDVSLLISASQASPILVTFQLRCWRRQLGTHSINHCDRGRVAGSYLPDDAADHLALNGVGLSGRRYASSLRLCSR